MKKMVILILPFILISLLSGCDKKSEENYQGSTTLLIAAASSLEASLEESIIPLFEKNNSQIQVKGTYDASGKLALQIEQGIPVDLFISAAVSPIDKLKEKGLIDEASVVNVLENKLVLIASKTSKEAYKSFQDIKKAETVAIGDPQSVPAGQYGKEALEAMGLWEEISQRATLGTNVSEVLHWVAEGSAEVGLVYATDAALELNRLTVVQEAPEEYLKSKILYPAAVTTDSKAKEAAEEFLEFLASKEVREIFKDYGFTPAQ